MLSGLDGRPNLLFIYIHLTLNLIRDANSGMGITYPSGSRPDGDGYRYDFLLVDGTRIQSEPLRVWAQVFFPTAM
jgi:hypothetical protein